MPILKITPGDTNSESLSITWESLVLVEALHRKTSSAAVVIFIWRKCWDGSLEATLFLAVGMYYAGRRRSSADREDHWPSKCSWTNSKSGQSGWPCSQPCPSHWRKAMIHFFRKSWNSNSLEGHTPADRTTSWCSVHMAVSIFSSSPSLLNNNIVSWIYMHSLLESRFSRQRRIRIKMCGTVPIQKWCLVWWNMKHNCTNLCKL